jgi:hypothetical protein
LVQSAIMIANLRTSFPRNRLIELCQGLKSVEISLERNCMKGSRNSQQIQWIRRFGIRYEPTMNWVRDIRDNLPQSIRQRDWIWENRPRASSERIRWLSMFFGEKFNHQDGDGMCPKFQIADRIDDEWAPNFLTRFPSYLLEGWSGLGFAGSGRLDSRTDADRMSDKPC